MNTTNEENVLMKLLYAMAYAAGYTVTFLRRHVLDIIKYGAVGMVILIIAAYLVKERLGIVLDIRHDGKTLTF
jgi:hypothetical protein